MESVLFLQWYTTHFHSSRITRPKAFAPRPRAKSKNHFKLKKSFLRDQFRLRDDLPILVGHFDILFDERKGRESVCDNGRKKGDSDPNGIGVYRDLLLTTFK